MTRAMKESGIEWIGKIPANWEVHPIYGYFTERKHKNRLGREDNLLSLSYGKIIRKDINTNGGLLPESFNTYNIIEAGDIIIRPTDLQNDKRSLRTGLSHEHGIITSAYIALRPNEGVNSRYFHYLLHAYDVQKVFYNMGNGVRQGLNYSEFAKLMVFAPSPIEQNKIADYLDKKCGEIDAITAEIQEQINTLEEYKKSVISETVTKGLNPNAPMKDSGVEWIGKIPANWEVKKLKYLCDTRNEKYTLNKGELDYFALENIVSWNSNYIKTENEYNLDGANLCYKGDVVFGKLRPYLAKVFLVEFDRCCSTEFAIFCNFNGCNRFYKYVFLTQGFVTTVDNSTYGIKMPRANIEFIKNVYIPNPSKAIQQEIADFLDNQCSQVEETIADKQEQIKTLEEYKKTLIYEYVTGKKEVA